MRVNIPIIMLEDVPTVVCEDTYATVPASRNVTKPRLLISDTLNWVELSQFIEAGFSFDWKEKNYTIARHQSMGVPDVFISFERFKTIERHASALFLSRDPDGQPKLHVALKPEDIQTAFNPILNVLLKNNVASFKIILASKLAEFETSGQYGKIFTIYLGKMTEGKRNRIAKEIDAAIKNSPRNLSTLNPPELRATDAKRSDSAIEDCEFVTVAFPRGAITKCVAIQQSPDTSSPNFFHGAAEPSSSAALLSTAEVSAISLLEDEGDYTWAATP